MAYRCMPIQTSASCMSSWPLDLNFPSHGAALLLHGNSSVKTLKYGKIWSCMPEINNNAACRCAFKHLHLDSDCSSCTWVTVASVCKAQVILRNSYSSSYAWLARTLSHDFRSTDRPEGLCAAITIYQHSHCSH